MADRCRGCAFTPGTEANRWPLITLQAQCCVELATPFYCHEAPLPGDGHTGTLCAGWAEAVRTRLDKGLYIVPLSTARREALCETIRIARMAEDDIGAGEQGDLAEATRLAKMLRRVLKVTEARRG